tara:strand:+ start:43 stop:282 length:240 start_codon:yes stop_codon:yes gene_type:complete
MSNEQNTIWLESFWEELNARCKQDKLKFTASQLVDWLEGHEGISNSDLLCSGWTETQAVEQVVERFESWLDKEKEDDIR